MHREQSNNQGHRGIDNEGSRGWDVGCENGVGRGNPPKLKARGRGRGRGREKRLAQKSSSVTESEDQAIKQSRFQQNQLLVRGLSALTTKDCLVNFIEAMSGGEVEHVMRRDDKALITMTNDITGKSSLCLKVYLKVDKSLLDRYFSYCLLISAYYIIIFNPWACTRYCWFCLFFVLVLTENVESCGRNLIAPKGSPILKGKTSFP